GGASNWRAGGVLAQFLPAAPERRRRDLDPGDAPAGWRPEPEDDAWLEAQALMSTIEDHELVDPTLSSEALLYRLFHERGVRVFPEQQVRQACRCSRERVFAMLKNFSDMERREMLTDDGELVVDCQFCSRRYVFSPDDF